MIAHRATICSLKSDFSLKSGFSGLQRPSAAEGGCVCIMPYRMGGAALCVNTVSGCGGDGLTDDGVMHGGRCG